jgi:putative addiction module component (TIGR02574 family)
MTAKQIESEVLKLPRRERARLARKLLDSIPMRRSESDRDVLAAWVAEVDRRVEELDSGKVKGIPAEVVFRRVRASLRR